ncbi:MAG: hypothetical protein K8I29_16635 [Alphaproteobacteria bacterium]|uniref:Uncharacterized protein n=1 Tax=Candidatus Nitrobium versatile TaxID=2884831 RepID=A0A953M2M3_9BACT|nr:hypothetical protein [Candidatus Nitrobium versatile]
MSEESKGKKREDREKGKEGGEEREGEGYSVGKEGYFISKRSIWLLAGGALGALAALTLGKAVRKARPAVVGAVKEGYAFKEWVAGKTEGIKEDMEDIVAEAKHSYHKDLDVSSGAVKREKEVLQKIEKEVEKRKTKRASGSREGQQEGKDETDE